MVHEALTTCLPLSLPHPHLLQPHWPFCRSSDISGMLRPCDFIHVSPLPLLFSKPVPHGQLPLFLCILCLKLAFSRALSWPFYLICTLSAPSSPYWLNIFFSYSTSHFLLHDLINFVTMFALYCFYPPVECKLPKGGGLYSILWCLPHAEFGACPMRGTWNIFVTWTEWIYS